MSTTAAQIVREHFARCGLEAKLLEQQRALIPSTTDELAVMHDREAVRWTCNFE
jgi:hypothetical protein